VQIAGRAADREVPVEAVVAPPKRPPVLKE